MADLSSILGGMVQGFKDFGTGLVDMFGTGAAAIGDTIASIQTGKSTNKNQDDFRKWLYNTDSTQDAAAKGLGTALNGVSTVADVIPGAQAVTANPLFNGLQGALGGVADELKMNGENADWGKAAQRAGIGAASGLASGYAGQALGNSGNKLLSNGLTRGAVSGALGGGIANAGYTGIEGGSVQDMINAGLYGAGTGALVGGTTGLARELIKPAHKMDVALTDEEKAARIANIDNQLAELDTTTPEGSARYKELTTAKESYKPKTVADLMLSPDDDVMYSKVAEGQLGLFDQPMPKPEPEPVALPKSLGEQASLFDQPNQPIVEAQVVDTEPVNTYAPVDGQVTQAMRDRAAEVLKNYAKKGVPDNELYDMIDESTLPAGYKEFREIVDSGKSYAKEKLGAESANKADLRRVVEYLYDDTAKQEEMLRNVKVEESNDAARRAMYGLAPRKSGSSFSEKMLRRAADEKLTKEFTEKIRKIENRVPELINSLRRYNPSDLSVRKGLTAAADELYSERLGIAPGNTIKYNGPADVRNAYGRYAKQSKNLALTRSNVSDPEQAISTVAHERLHSFQNEADLNRGKYGATNRYDKRVTDAFDDLRKDLENIKAYKNASEIVDRYGGKDADYYGSTAEQEARMLQQYLNNKGFTDLQQLKGSGYRAGEFGSEVNAPFDKFFDKLRALSKKGVALPALTALFGGSAIMAATQGDDKKKKSEVK